jgi:pilus assembly protein FimV
MMLAIFRANPSAFDGNINRLHRGAVLTIPSHADVAAISKAEAKREIHAQMSAWRKAPTANVAAATVATAAPVAANATSQAPTAAAPVAAAPVATPVAGEAAESLATARLDHRVQSLEKELSEMQAVLHSEREQLFAMQRQAAREVKPVAPAPLIVASGAPPAQAKSAYTGLVTVIAGLGALAAALAAVFIRRRRVPTPNAPLNRAMDGADTAAGSVLDLTAAAPPSAADSPEAVPGLPTVATEVTTEVAAEVAADEVTQPALPVLPDEPAEHMEVAHDTTVNLLAKTVNLRVDTTRLDYNFLDLDLTAQHVQMPSVLNETAVVKERRTNLADVLKLAIEREPDRQDLRMKLLELYYSAAATNRTAFLDVVQKLARDRDLLQADQWDKIAFMGRQIAGENPMFAEPDDEDLADCA